jgi:tRNA(adenine34) deaminase
VISRDGKVIAESINRVRHERDVTRHAEVVAISAAQKALGTVSLDDCTIYVSAESCAYCCYAIRESRIGRAVFGLRSPHMGGVSKWPILTDEDLSNTMPECSRRRRKSSRASWRMRPRKPCSHTIRCRAA